MHGLFNIGYRHTLRCICIKILPLQTVSEYDTWIWKMAGSGSQYKCHHYCPENEHEGFFFSPCQPQLCTSPLYKAETHTVHYTT